MSELNEAQRAALAGLVAGVVLELIETLTLGATAQDATFATVLDGDADGSYLIIGNMIAGANFAQLALQPNALATNQNDAFVNGNRTTVTTGGSGQLQIAPSIADVDGEAFFFAFLQAKTLSRRRGFFSIGFTANAAFSGSFNTFLNVGAWNETATNITSLRLAGDRANAQKVGSIYRLYRVKIP